MSTHNIPFQCKIESQPKLTQICSYGIYFQGTQERVQNIRGKRANSVRATEVLLYIFIFCEGYLCGHFTLCDYFLFCVEGG